MNKVCVVCGSTKGLMGTSMYDNKWRCLKCHNKHINKIIKINDINLIEKEVTLENGRNK